jgi:pseudouridylate synthase
VLAGALAAAEAAGATGKEATPFVLGRFHEGTGGESVRANVALVLRNAALAAAIAAA